MIEKSKFHKYIHSFLDIVALCRAVAVSDKMNGEKKICIITSNLSELFANYSDYKENQNWVMVIPLWIAALFEFYVTDKISDDAKQLIEVTKQCFFEGIKYAKEGCHLYQISAAINDYADKFGYGVVRDLVGHGIGREMHEDPQIPNFRQRRRGMKLQAGMTLCIEPMINMGRADVAFMDDDWTVVTDDGSLAAHYENTVLITKGEPEILTLI